MKVNGKVYRTIWIDAGDDSAVKIIEQNRLPHDFVVCDLRSVDDFAIAIKEMKVRGAGLIGATAGYGMYVAALTAPQKGFEEFIAKAGERLKATRPTAVNLAWAVERQLREMAASSDLEEKIRIAKRTAIAIADEDAEFCKRLGEHGCLIPPELPPDKS